MRFLFIGLLALLMAGCGPIPAHSGVNQFLTQQRHSYATDDIAVPLPSLPNQGPTFGRQTSQPQVYYLNTPNGLVRKTCQTTYQGQTYCY